MIDETVVRKLEKAFEDALNVVQACTHAGIGRTAYYKKLKEDEHFANRMAKAQLYPQLAVRQIVLRQIIKGKDGNLGLKYLERTEQAVFSTRVITTQADDLPIQDVVDDRTQELIDKYGIRGEAERAKARAGKRAAKA